MNGRPVNALGRLLAAGVGMSTLVRCFFRIFYTIQAFISGRGFSCAALQGESEYNISINCDMTVSCNCQDDGSGILGSLDQNSFEEIFFGPVANSFRASLAGGKLPILTCARCSELRRIRSERHQRGVTSSVPRLPYRGLLVENTVACNLRCPGCIRPKVVKVRKKTQMSPDDVRTAAELIRRLKIQKLFYFNRGEPFLSPHILDEIKIIRALNPDLYIVTSTNGMFLNTDEKREAALLMDEVIFSIDGCDQKSLRKYQRGGDFNQMLKNLRELVCLRNERGLHVPQVEWKYLLFNWNDRPEQIRQAIQLANSTGADLISFWPTNDPAFGISWRYRFGLFGRIGTKSWKGRELRLSGKI